MNLSDIYVVGYMPATVTDNAVTEAEMALGTRFPVGYREYITALGDGVYNDWVSIFTPSAIIDGNTEFQERWSWLAAGGDYDGYQGFDQFPVTRLLESIALFDTRSGDECVFHPTQPAELYVIPREDPIVYKIGGTLADALHWITESGVLRPRFRVRTLTVEGDLVDRQVVYFEPNLDRVTERFALVGPAAYERLREVLIKMALAAGNEMLLIEQTNLDDSVGRQSLILLMVECRGKVRCLPRPDGISVSVSYDPTSRINNLDRVVDYLENAANL